MTSRERILASLARAPVDRIPIDFGGTRQSGISVFAYARLAGHLAAGGSRSAVRAATARPRVFDLYQMLAEVAPEIAARFGADCLLVNRPAVAFGIANKDWKRWHLHDGTEVEVPGGFFPEATPEGGYFLRRNGEVIAEMPARGFYFDRVEKYPGALHPELDSWEPPRLSAADLAHYEGEAARLQCATDKALVIALGPPFELFCGLGSGGFEDWMITFASEPHYVTALYRKLTDAWLENLEALHGAVGDRVQVLQFADDFGTQAAPFLSVSSFRELVMPAYKRGLDWIHQRTNWKVLLHSDGAIFPLLPSLVEMGVDILNPVQTTAAGMDPRRLKAQFGDRLAFWGGSCDCQHTLVRGTPAQVAAEARAHLEALSPGGGHVFASVHNVQAGVPPENLVALFDTALDFSPG